MLYMYDNKNVVANKIPTINSCFMPRDSTFLYGVFAPGGYSKSFVFCIII